MMILIRREIRLLLSGGSGVMTACGFFLVVISLFPFALDALPDLMRQSAAGIIWVALFLSMLLSLERIWHRDYEDGTYDMYVVGNLNMLAVVSAKMTAYILALGTPLLIIAGLGGVMLSIPLPAIPSFCLSLAIGVVYIAAVGAIGGALTCGAKNPGVLLALLLLPMCVPMLILGVMLMQSMLAELPWHAYLTLQAALLVAAVPLSCLAAASILTVQVKTR